MKVSLMVSRTECACAWDIRFKFLISCRRSLVFFWSPLSWLYISGETVKSLVIYWPVAKVAGFGGGVGFCLSFSKLKNNKLMKF